MLAPSRFPKLLACNNIVPCADPSPMGTETIKNIAYPAGAAGCG